MNQIYDIDEDEDVNRQNAVELVEERFKKTLYRFPFPPCTDVCFESEWCLISCVKV